VRIDEAADASKALDVQLARYASALHRRHAMPEQRARDCASKARRPTAEHHQVEFLRAWGRHQITSPAGIELYERSSDARAAGLAVRPD
jgi:hypothetical protein